MCKGGSKCRRRAVWGGRCPNPVGAPGLILFIGIDLIRANVNADVLHVEVKLSDGVVKPVDASVQGGVLAMVLVQRCPQPLHHL